MHTSSIIPQHYFECFSLNQATLTSDEICQLNQEFDLWLHSIFAEEDMLNLVTARAQFVDLILTKLWTQHKLDEDQIALLAVGGYGRKELHPHSDVDILLLTQNDITPELEDKISAFITQLWDVKLDIGQSVRDIDECLKQAHKDVTVATNLMEMRFICGNQQFAEQLEKSLQDDDFWHAEKFFIAKRNEQNHRHQQYHGAAYTLEPNLKANPGGLRDIQTITWVAKRHFNADSLEQLVDHSYLTKNEFTELLECQDYLWRMRFCLHYVAGRSENRLLFDYQAEVAAMMDFGEHGKTAVENMMKRFFRVIARVAELNKMLLQHFEYRILLKDHPINKTAINNDFHIENGLICTSNDRVFLRPNKLIELFLLITQHSEIKNLHPETLRQLRNARRRLVSRLNDYSECRKMFVDIIRHPRGLGLALNLMHRHSILSAYLPEWRSIVGQMQFDLFHAYSVDEHSYRLLKNLHRFSQVEHNHEFPLCSKIVQRIRKPELLYFAGIFHDIAKGRGGNHAELGAIDALNFSKLHDLSEHDGRMIAWLVQEHLTMSVTAQRRDISDENVIKTFAETVKDEARLDYLYCLTVADMRATNESLWNSWKANLLEDLYSATKRAFRHGLEKPVDIRAKIRENQQQAAQLLQELDIQPQQYKNLWDTFKADYFLRYSPQQITWHSQHILQHDNYKPLVLISPKPYRGGTEVFIYTPDQDNIFAITAALLSSKKLSIHDAKIITSKNNFTLNTFVVLDQRHKPVKDHYRAQDIQQALTERLGQCTLEKVIIQPIYKRFEQFDVPIKVTFIKNSSKRTMVEIRSLDRPGLLASLGQVFQNCQLRIHSAKITTFGEQVEDVFTLSNADNLALTEQEQKLLAKHLQNDIA